VLEACLAQVKALHYRHRQKVSLIGWSLGGIYARELAKELPDLVRSVITLGSPFSGPPRATNAWRFFELVSGQSAEDHELVDQIKVAPRVPTTSIFSATDGVVAWQCSINPDEPHCENVAVMASHIGMGMNPLALAVIADRLAQPEGQWRRFDAQGASRWFTRPMNGPVVAAAAAA
jgi:pimeloyl-ACP methyl ester carboxylesterase